MSSAGSACVLTWMVPHCILCEPQYIIHSTASRARVSPPRSWARIPFMVHRATSVAHAQPAHHLWPQCAVSY